MMDAVNLDKMKLKQNAIGEEQKVHRKTVVLIRGKEPKMKEECEWCKWRKE